MGLWGLCWWPEASGGEESSLCELWWQGIGGFSVGQKAWLEPFGPPGQGRVKALIVCKTAYLGGLRRHVNLGSSGCIHNSECFQLFSQATASPPALHDPPVAQA